MTDRLPLEGEKEPKVLLNSGELDARIRGRYQPPHWVVLSQVRDGTGWSSAGRSADTMAFGTWPSRGLSIVGFEIKVDRQDWKRELAVPEKAESIARFCDEWYLVTCDDVAKPEEVPQAWGWWTATEKGLKLMKAAVPNLQHEVGRPLLMSILRNVSKNYVPSSRLAELAEAQAQAKAAQMVEDLRHELDQAKALSERVKTFEAACGISLEDEYSFPPAETGAIVKTAISRQLFYDMQQLEHMAETVRGVLENLSKMPLFKAGEEKRRLARE